MPRSVTPRGVLTTAAALAAGVVVAVGATAGSYAYLNSTSVVGQAGVRVSASTSLLTLQRGADAPAASIALPAAQYRLLPGDIVNQNLALTHTGNVRILLYSLVADDGPLETRVASGACPASGVVTGPAITAQGNVFATGAPNSTGPICLQVLLPASAPASVENATLSYTVRIDAYQIGVP